MIDDTILMERFKDEGTLDHFEAEESIELLLDLARCPGNRKEKAEKLLDSFGSFRGVLEAREEQLIRVKGIGKGTASAIQLIVNMMRLWERSEMLDISFIRSASDAEKYCKSLLMGLRNERFYTICLNTKCRILGKRMISEGSLGEVNAYPRIVMETALNYNAHSVILCHNHPGGTNYPSQEDILSTNGLQKLLKGVGVLILDHIIVAGNETYSMMKHGDICT